MGSSGRLSSNLARSAHQNSESLSSIDTRTTRHTSCDPSDRVKIETSLMYDTTYRPALSAAFDTLDQYLVRWVRRKYKRMKDTVSRARERLIGFRHRDPGLFAHSSLSANGGQIGAG
jgi:hypothetical protein